MTINRRKFVVATAGAAGAVLLAPALQRACADAPRSGKLQFGIIADIHQDVMHDGVERVSAFVRSMNERKADFVLSLGDFCVPHARNETFFAAWKQFSGPRHHVLGNHDTDGGYRREQVVEFYGTPARFYSFDRHGVHFVILDGNDPDGKTHGYSSFVADDQLKWLAADLAATKLPTLISIHQPIDGWDKNVKNAAKVRAVLRKPTKQPGSPKSLPCSQAIAISITCASPMASRTFRSTALRMCGLPRVT